MSEQEKLASSSQGLQVAGKMYRVEKSEPVGEMSFFKMTPCT
jgi:hypothetical protein